MAMSGCKIRLLGGMSIVIDGEETAPAIAGGKAKLLLAYLALSADTPVGRKQVAFDFWPDSTEKQALTNLRKLLHDLRSCCPRIDRYLIVGSATLQWQTQLSCWTDVRAFEQAAQGESLHQLRTAEALYSGELLPGYYEDWVDERRQLLAHQNLTVLDKLVAALESRREFASALLFAKKLLGCNPLREQSYRTLMRLQAMNDDRAGIAQVYRQMCVTWQDELGVAPAAETTRLYEKLVRRGEEVPKLRPGSAPLIGRIDEWGCLQDVWHKAAAGSAMFIILKGESGIGKTRLALEFQALVDSLGEQTAFACCYPSLRTLAYAPVTAWLRSFPVPDLDPSWLTELVRLLPELAERFPDMPRPGPVRESWQLAKWYEAIARMLMAGQPLLLVLDDMQWSDGETLRLLAYLLRRDAAAKLLVIATMRTDEEPDTDVEHFVSGLRLERKLTEIDLASLTEDETKRLMATAVGDELAERRASDLYADTGGNPLFVTEMLRDWQRSGCSGELQPSPLMKHIVAERLGKLSPLHRRLVALIATAGRPVPVALLAILSGMDETRVAAKIAPLLRLKILRETGDGSCDFTHRLIMEAAYGLNGASNRSRNHRRFAEGLLAYCRERPAEASAAAEIAYHYELADMAREAADYYEQAAAAAAKMYANDTQIRYYRKLSELLPAERILPNLVKLGDALILTGNWSEAETTYRQWLAQSGSLATLQERSRCEIALGNCLRLQGKYEEAEICLERALRRCEMTEDTEGLISVCVTLGILHYYRGSCDKALDYLNRTAALPDCDNRSREECRAFGIIGHIYYDRCEYEQAVYWIKRQIGLAADIGDKYAIEQAFGLLAMVYMDTDEMEAAFDLLAEKAEISKSIGDRMGFAIAHGMLGKHSEHLGRHDDAEARIAYCLEEAVAVEDWRAAAIMLCYAGRNYMALQQLEAAEQMLERSRQLFRRLQTPYFACETLYCIALLKRRRQQYESAAAATEEAIGMADRLRRTDMQINLAVMRIQLEAAVERISRAEAKSALCRLLERQASPQHRAALLFAVWQADPDDAHARASALQLNEALFRKSGKTLYADRCHEMGGTALSAPSLRLPAYAAAALPERARSISPAVLDAVDRYFGC